jgi:bacterioferritin (cytochrome b1)
MLFLAEHARTHRARSVRSGAEILHNEEHRVDFLETNLELIAKMGRENYIQLQSAD